jgi:hypothetical protein
MESEMKPDLTTPARRVFILHTLVGASVMAAQAPAQAADSESGPVKETDPYPKSMGFRLNTANVDQVKYPRHTIEQHCSECQLFNGEPGDQTGTCSFFSRVVPVTGWCRNFKQRKAVG